MIWFRLGTISAKPNAKRRTEEYQVSCPKSNPDISEYFGNFVLSYIGCRLEASRPCLRNSLNIIILLVCYKSLFSFFFRYGHDDLDFVVLFHQLGKEFLYIFCCDAVDQRFIVFCIIDTCVEILIQIAQPVAVFLFWASLYFFSIYSLIFCMCSADGPSLAIFPTVR